MKTLTNFLSTRFGKLAIFGGAIIGLIAICGICSICGLLPGSGSNKTGVAKIATLPQLDTPVPPTNTPAPTETPLPPTEAPTNTPIPPDPTATPEPVIEANYEDYFTTVANKTKELGDALGSLGELMTDPQIGTDDWTIAVSLQMATIQLAHEAISDLEIPPGLEGFHEFLTSATGDCSEATDHLAKGLDNLDKNELDLSASFIKSCNGKLDDLTKRMNEAIEQLE